MKYEVTATSPSRPYGRLRLVSASFTLRTSHFLVAAFCVALAATHTWPLVTAPARLSLNWHADALLNEWALAWVAHQLPRAPGELFDANIFHPARHSLAFSEPLLAPALLGAPLAWLGASPVLVYNLLLLAGLALSALATYALVYDWTGDRAAGLLAGSAFAFNTHTLSRLAHIQGIHIYSLPIAVLAIDRVVSRARLRDALLLAACLILMAYTSGYLAVFGALTVAVAVATRVGDWRTRWRPVAAALALAAVVAAVAILPVYLPYRTVAREYGMTRSLDNVAQFSATPAGYLATEARVHAAWSRRFISQSTNMFFAGVVALAFAATAAAFSLRARRETAQRRRVLMLLALAAAGFILSLGTLTPLYGWLFALFPPMQGLRVAARFGNLYLLAVAVLAGIGLAAARAALRDRQAAARLAAAAIALANVEAFTGPIRYERFDGIPRVYALLAEETEPVALVEIPMYPPEAIHENAAYVFASTAHWRPLVNGYSGYIPPAYRELAPIVWTFPDRAAIEAIRHAGATHVMVHPERLLNEADPTVRAVAAIPDLELVAIGDNGIRLYRIRRAKSAP